MIRLAPLLVLLSLCACSGDPRLRYLWKVEGVRVMPQHEDPSTTSFLQVEVRLIQAPVSALDRAHTSSRGGFTLQTSVAPDTVASWLRLDRERYGQSDPASTALALSPDQAAEFSLIPWVDRPGERVTVELAHWSGEDPVELGLRVRATADGVERAQAFEITVSDRGTLAIFLPHFGVTAPEEAKAVLLSARRIQIPSASDSLIPGK